MQYQSNHAMVTAIISLLFVLLGGVFIRQRIAFFLLALISVSITVFILIMVMFSY